MDKSYAILPCNGLDKCAGCVSKEVAVMLLENTDSEIVCPVFYRVAQTKYNQVLEEKPLLVIDGCNVRCASKLAGEKNLRINKKINITEEAKDHDIVLSHGLRIGENEISLAKIIFDKLTRSSEVATQTKSTVIIPEVLNYKVYTKDKFIFRIPQDEGFYFNENDVWVYVSGNKARIGVTDFVQKSLSDIMFFTAPTIGREIEQFEEVGDIESGKAMFEIVSPVSGMITAVNEKLLESPELINENPYEQGWIAEMALSDFESDKELLYDFEGYLPVLKRKVDEFHV